MKDLIERLEKAKEGSRELSDMVLVAHGWAAPTEDNEGWFTPDGLFVSANRERLDPTRSLDAAMSLAPEGFTLQLHQWRGGDGKTYARAIVEPEKPPTYSSESDSGTTRSLPLALTIAALKAMESSNG
jgi:hypothetical protein